MYVDYSQLLVQLDYDKLPTESLNASDNNAKILSYSIGRCLQAGSQSLLRKFSTTSVQSDKDGFANYY